MPNESAAPPAPPAHTEAVFDILTRCAGQMRLITYGDIAKEVGFAPIGIGMQLGYIRDHICRARQLPWLHSIAVNASGRPGDAFLPESARIDESDLHVLWRGMVLQVFGYDWSNVPFGNAKG